MKRQSPQLSSALSFLRELIDSGAQPAGSRLKPVSQLAKQAGVSLVTMWKAVDELKSTGELTGKPRGAVYVVGEPDKEKKSSLHYSTLWETVRDTIRQEILNGTYEPGQRLPRYKEMQARYGVVAATIKKALNALLEEKLIGPYEGGYCVAEPKRMKGSSKIVIVSYGYIPGEINLNAINLSLVRILDTECSRRNINIENAIFTRRENDAVDVYKAGTTVPYDLSNDDNVLGYVYLIMSENALEDDLLRLMARKKVPVIISDTHEEWNPRRWFSRAGNVSIVKVSNPPNAALNIVQFLLNKGHSQCAFFSHLHDHLFSKQRLDNLNTAFQASGHMGAITPFTLSYDTETPRDEENALQFKALNDFHDSWKKNVSWHVLHHVEPSLLHLKMQAHDFSDMQKMMEPMFEEALAKKELTTWICVNDVAALMAQYFLQEKHPSAGRNISIISYDNSDLAIANRFTSYNFGTREAAFHMLRHIAEPGKLMRRKSFQTIFVDGIIVQRGSVRDLRMPHSR